MNVHTALENLKKKLRAKRFKKKDDTISESSLIKEREIAHPSSEVKRKRERGNPRMKRRKRTSGFRKR